MISNVNTSSLSKQAISLYYSLYNTNKYVDLITLAVGLRMTPNETDNAIKELQDANLIETRTVIRKKNER